jgi:N-acetylglucosaminyldiphosphoundecaprenol N-acetyl-beta-D-mannosaminyltransferase
MPVCPKVDLFGMQVDVIDLSGAADRVLEWAREPFHRCHYVVTPNVDHAVMFQERADLRDAYVDASLVLADGAPLVAAANMLGRKLPGRVAGSDLTPLLFQRATDEADSQPPLRVFLLGAGPGVADRAAAEILRRWPRVEIAGTYCPPMGFDKDEAENEKCLEAVAEARPDLVVLGVGAPRQELWASRFADRIQAKVVLCVGATIDFLAGEKQRSPVWMRRTGLEWVHRLLTEPRRLAARYARDAWVFPRLVWREWRRGD